MILRIIVISFCYHHIALNLHQGRDTFRNHNFDKQSEEDKEYNKRYVRGKTGTLQNAKFAVDEKGDFKRPVSY